MKIVFVGPAHPFRGGIAAFNDKLAEELSLQGHEVIIYTFKLQYPSFLFPGESQYSDSPKINNIKTIELINSINPLNWISSASKIKKEKADIVISRFWLPFMGPSLGSILRQLKSKKTRVISIVDNAIPHESRPGDKAFTKYFLKGNDAFITLSKEVKKELEGFKTNKEILFTPHPLYDHYGELIDLLEAKKKLNLDQSKKYILFFGLVREYKGLDLLLKAYSETKDLQEEVEIIIAGEYYEKKEKYDSLIESLGIQDKVHQSNGFIPDHEVNLYFSACDLVVQPYKTATQSGVTQVAYHFEKPMIVTNVGGLAEICPDGKVGYISEPNTDNLAEKLEQFFSGDSNRFQSTIQEEKEKYSWSIFIDKLLSLYNRIN